jgi:hypothetical protein
MFCNISVNTAQCHQPIYRNNKITKSLSTQTVLITKYYSGNQIEKNEMGGARSTYGEKKGAYRILVGTPEGSRPPGRPRRRWEDNIKMDLQEVGGEWTGLSWLRIETGGGLL